MMSLFVPSPRKNSTRLADAELELAGRIGAPFGDAVAAEAEAFDLLDRELRVGDA